MSGAAEAHGPRRDRVALAGALLIALGWLAYGAATVGQHGVTLDETSILYGGDRTLFFLTHPWVHDALAFDQPNDPAGFHCRFERFPDFADTWHYPAMPGVWMAASNAVFHDWLGWTDDIDGHHLGLLALHALGLFVLAIYACKLLGRRAGLSAAFLYALYPSIVGYAFNNPKDLPASDFYTAALLAAGSAFHHRRPRDLWASGVLVGLSLSSKLNGVFAIATLALWLLLLRPTRQELRAAGLFRPLCWLPAVAFAVFFLLWPWLWYGTPLTWAKHLFEYLRFYGTFSHSARASFTAFPFRAAGAMTPPLVLGLAALGTVRLFRRDFALRPLRWLFLLWLGLPLLRVALPFSEFYDGNRHFIEYIGALCALAGLGAGWILEASARRWRGSELVWASCFAAVLWQPLVAYRPFEGTYFNGFVGGLGGAQEEALFFMLSPPHDSRASGSEGDFWNSSLRGALSLAAHLLPPGAVLGTCGPSVVNVRANLTAPPPFRVTSWRDGRADYLYFMGRECYCKQSDLRKAETERPVVARVTRGGGLIYEILGPRSPYPLPPVSPHSRYEDLPHYPTRRAPPQHRRRRRPSARFPIGRPVDFE